VRDATLNLFMLCSLVFCAVFTLICVLPRKRVHRSLPAREAHKETKPSIKVEVLLMSGQVVATLAVDVDETCGKIKSDIEMSRGVTDKARQLLLGGTVLEDDLPLLEYGPFQGNCASVLLIRDAEWRLLTLEGKWMPTRLEEWQPQEWHAYVKHRLYDGNNCGHAFDVYGGKRPRGPYRLTSWNPPVWESKIAGPGYTGTEWLKLMPGGMLELWQRRSNLEEQIVFYYERESRVDSLRNLFLEVRLFLMPWERTDSRTTDMPAKDWLEAI